MATQVSAQLKENQTWLEEQLADCADVKMRPMHLGTGEGVECLAVYIEVTVDQLMLGQSMPGELFLRLDRENPEKIRKTLGRNALGLSDCSTVTTMEEGLAALFTGDLLFLADGYAGIVRMGTKGYPARSVSNAESEKVLRGSNEGFGESVKQNTALLRKRIRSSGLKVKELHVGERSDTLIALVYIEELIYPDILEQLEERLQAYAIDGVLDGGVLEQLAEKHWASPFPQFQSTERPDLAAMELLDGRIAVLCDNSPSALLVPCDIRNFMNVSEDRYNRFELVTFQRIMRYAAMILATILSGLYLAVIDFHTAILPTPLLLSFAEARKGVPFPSLMEILLMELAFELIREASVRMPGPLSGTIGIVGGLIIGDAAVSANLVSPMAVVVVALGALGSFAIPNEEFGAALRLLKFGFIFLGGFFGMFGIVACLYLVLGHLASLESFGIPYLMPFVGRGVADYHKGHDGVMRGPLGQMKWRPIFAKRDQRLRLRKEK